MRSNETIILISKSLVSSDTRLYNSNHIFSPSDSSDAEGEVFFTRLSIGTSNPMSHASLTFNALAMMYIRSCLGSKSPLKYWLNELLGMSASLQSSACRIPFIFNAFLNRADIDSCLGSYNCLTSFFLNNTTRVRKNQPFCKKSFEKVQIFLKKLLTRFDKHVIISSVKQNKNMSKTTYFFTQ